MNKQILAGNCSHTSHLEISKLKTIQKSGYECYGSFLQSNFSISEISKKCFYPLAQSFYF